MASFLSTHAHLVTIGDDAVVLDTRTSSYFCLAGAASVIHRDGETITIEDADLKDEFEGAGFLATAPHDRQAIGAPRPARDLGLHVAERVSLKDYLLILGAWASMVLDYHGRSFEQVLKVARREGPGVRTGAPTQDAARLVAAFERVLPWLPFQGVCFYRSFLLLRILRRRGHDAHWTVGVRTWPFMAHCWLQVGDTVLDDTADRLIAFDSILVV